MLYSLILWSCDLSFISLIFFIATSHHEHISMFGGQQIIAYPADLLKMEVLIQLTYLFAILQVVN